MTIRFDEKGKFFTDVVKKEIVPVVIQMAGFFIHGDVHIRPDERLLDAINANERFLAITDAIVFGTDGAEKYRSEFLSVNRDHVIWLIPVDQLNESQPGGGD